MAAENATLRILPRPLLSALVACAIGTIFFFAGVLWWFLPRGGYIAGEVVAVGEQNFVVKDERGFEKVVSIGDGFVTKRGRDIVRVLDAHGRKSWSPDTQGGIE